MFFIKRLLVFVGVGAGIIGLAAGIAHSTDYGPPVDKPHVSCTAIWIDPPVGAWVHLVGDIEGHDADGNYVEYHADEYGIAYGHNTYFPQSFNKLDSLFGEVEFELAATWSLGEGYSQASGGYITCHEGEEVTPPTTVPVTAPEQPAAPPSTVLGSSVTTYCTTEACLLPSKKDKDARGVPVAQELPRTGSTTLPLGLIGLGSLPIGAALAMVGRKKVAR